MLLYCIETAAHTCKTRTRGRGKSFPKGSFTVFVTCGFLPSGSTSDCAFATVDTARKRQNANDFILRSAVIEHNTKTDKSTMSHYIDRRCDKYVPATNDRAECLRHRLIINPMHGPPQGVPGPCKECTYIYKKG